MLLEPFRSVSAQNVLDTYTYGVKGGREVDTPTVDPRQYYPHPPTALLPPPHFAHPLSIRPPVQPPPPTVATFEQPIAKNTHFY